MSGLPASWGKVAIGEVAEVNPRPTADPPSDDSLVSFVPMAACEAETGRLDATETRLFGELRRKSYRRFEDGDVVVAKITPSMENGKAALARNLVSGQAFGTTEFHVLRPSHGLDARYLLHFVLQHSFRAEAAHHMTGTAGQLRVPADFLRKASMPLPPLDEQQRIVETIEEQFSRLDAGVESVHRAKRNLARLRAAVLKAAVEGRLVPQRSTDGRASELLAELSSLRRQVWEYKHPGKQYKEPRFPDVRESGMDLSLGWAMVSVEQVSSRIEYGTSAKASPDVPGGVPVLRMGNIVDGSLSLDDLKYLPPDHLDVARFSLAAGDLLFNRTNSAELVGKSAVYGESDPPALFASYLIRVRFLSGIDPRYVAHVINSPYGRAHLARVRSQQVGQANVNGSKLAAFPVPLPPAAEQVRIVAEIERQFSVIGALEGALDSACIRAAGLRRSTLRDAFAGRLVSKRSVLRVADA